MTEHHDMLRHLAFFEELGAMDEADSDWRSVSAGLVLMRLLDRWMLEGSDSLDAHSVSGVRAAIGEISDNTPLRRILSSIVDAMTCTGGVEMHSVTPRLMAYGQALEYESKLALAADVYRTIVAHANPIDDWDLAIPAHNRLGATLLQLGQLESAAAAYDEAGRVAANANDMMGVLRSQVGRAKVCIALGNIPQAEAELDDAILRAEQPGLEDIRSRALHDRAHVAALRGHYEGTIRYAYQALELSTSRRERDRILGDIAAGFSDLGLLSVARDAYLVLVATAQEQYVRWMSELNLLEIVAREGSEPQFDKYRRSLEGEEFTPQLRVIYLLHVGRGYDLLGRSNEGVPYLERAARLADEFKFNQLSFEAERALAECRKRVAQRPAQKPVAVPESIRDVVYVIEDMRRLVGVS